MLVIEGKAMAGLLGMSKANSTSYVGLERNMDGLAIADVRLHKTKGWQVEAYQWLPSEQDAQQDQLAFKKTVRSMGLKGRACNYVLADDQYQMFLLESPKLRGEELVQAMSWQVKDLLGYPVHEAVIDVIELPDSVAKSGKPMLYVVAVPETVVSEIVHEVNQTGLDLQSIDISELALGNLIELWGSHPRGEALAMVQPGRGELVIFHSGQLIMSRKFDLAYQVGQNDAPLPKEQLILELQRTLDYYERQLGQSLPAKIHLTGKHLSANQWDGQLEGALDIPIELMNLQPYWYSDKCHGQERNYYALAAIGGALRGLLQSGKLQVEAA